MNSAVCSAILLLLAFAGFSAARTHERRSILGLSSGLFGQDEEKPVKDDGFEMKTVADQAGLVSYDDNGEPYMMCATGKNTFQACYLPKDKPVYDKGLACYAVWFGSQSFQGCWVNPMPSLRQCEKRKCRADGRSKTGINFCCCFGDNCNADYSIA